MSSFDRSRYRLSQGIPPNWEHALQVYGFSSAVSETIGFALFRDEKFEFVKRVGVAGAQGGALLFNEREDDGALKRQVVVKYYQDSRAEPGSLSGVGSFSDDDSMDLDDSGDSNDIVSGGSINDEAANGEFDALNELRGAKHIIQLLNPGKAVLGKRLALFMEYVGHGDLGSALDKFTKRRQRIPNRILWSLFLCFIRMCIAMEHPPAALPDAPVQTETIPAVRTSTKRIQHSDMHFGNVLVGGIDEREQEHTLGPLLKLIDFGSSRITGRGGSSGLPSIASLTLDDGDDVDMGDPNDDDDDDNEDDIVEEVVEETMEDMMDEDNEESIISTTGHSASSGKNLFDVGIFMASLALGEDTIPLPSDAAYSITVNTSAAGAVNIPIQAPPDLNDAPITNQLRDLIRRCTAVDVDDRPSLQEALEICSNNVNKDFPAIAPELDPRTLLFETDNVVKPIIKEFFLDADFTEEDQRLRTGRRRTVPHPQWVLDLEDRRARRRRARQQGQPRRSAPARRIQQVQYSRGIIALVKSFVAPSLRSIRSGLQI